LKIAGFPKVLGCIDGTFIKIPTPIHKIKSTYVNGREAHRERMENCIT